MEEERGRTEKVCGREGMRGEVRGGFEWASRGSKLGSGGRRSSAVFLCGAWCGVEILAGENMNGVEVGA